MINKFIGFGIGLAASLSIAQQLACNTCVQMQNLLPERKYVTDPCTQEKIDTTWTYNQELFDNFIDVRKTEEGKIETLLIGATNDTYSPEDEQQGNYFLSIRETNGIAIYGRQIDIMSEKTRVHFPATGSEAILEIRNTTKCEKVLEEDILGYGFRY